MNFRNRFGAALLTFGVVLASQALAIDFAGKTNEELMGMNPQQMSAEEREQFRTEMRQRMQNMDPAEQESFRNEMRGQRGGGQGGGRQGGRGGY